MGVLHRAFDLNTIPPSGSTKVMILTEDEFQFAYATIDSIQSPLDVAGLATDADIADLQSQIGVSGSYASQDKYYATNNGGGQNFKVGDDLWIGDVNLANTMQVSGAQNSGSGYIKFGSGSTTPILGYGGSNGYISLSSVLSLTPQATLGTAPTGSLAVSGSNLYFFNGAWVQII